ncbi:hypothetical protein F442_02891 [Phytophthora nicotianae P10297]|uniref:Uncharacterized protein n=1 Tax=Phytophthora nicotianae P10297 TaxID=1317064 RepID=W2ZXM1_PHYNI|nr:hypothetical protein F442_02891 [Phytophthora nicotianae P10297]
MSGYVHVLQWLVENLRKDFSCLRDGCLSPIDRAAQHGHLAAVAWLHENYPKSYSPDTLALAAQCGRIKILRWLHSYDSLYLHDGHTDVVQAMLVATRSGQLAVVKWLYHNARELEGDDRAYNLQAAIQLAASQGHTRIELWLLNRTRGVDQVDDYQCNDINRGRKRVRRSDHIA